jgi:Putative zinc-finger
MRRRLLPYVEGQLDTRRVSRLEQHLLGCEECREFLVRLRAGHSLAQRLARLPSMDGNLPDFADLMQPAAMTSRPSRRSRTAWDWPDRLATPRVVAALAALVILQTAILVVSNRGVVFGERTAVSATPPAIDLNQFRLLKISELRFNDRPHVATDGYVEDVHADQEEGTVAFKLVESRGASEPFVVCEIVSPIQMAAPRKGSHVRVYGVARYDAQSDRKWYEVNPVFDIATLKR